MEGVEYDLHQGWRVLHQARVGQVKREIVSCSDSKTTTPAHGVLLLVGRAPDSPNPFADSTGGGFVAVDKADGRQDGEGSAAVLFLPDPASSLQQTGCEAEGTPTPTPGLTPAAAAEEGPLLPVLPDAAHLVCNTCDIVELTISELEEGVVPVAGPEAGGVQEGEGAAGGGGTPPPCAPLQPRAPLVLWLTADSGVLSKTGFLFCTAAAATPPPSEPAAPTPAEAPPPCDGDDGNGAEPEEEAAAEAAGHLPAKPTTPQYCSLSHASIPEISIFKEELERVMMEHHEQQDARGCAAQPQGGGPDPSAAAAGQDLQDHSQHRSSVPRSEGLEEWEAGGMIEPVTACPFDELPTPELPSEVKSPHADPGLPSSGLQGNYAEDMACASQEEEWRRHLYHRGGSSHRSHSPQDSARGLISVLAGTGSRLAHGVGVGSRRGGGDGTLLNNVQKGVQTIGSGVASTLTSLQGHITQQGGLFSMFAEREKEQRPAGSGEAGTAPNGEACEGGGRRPGVAEVRFADPNDDDEFSDFVCEEEEGDEPEEAGAVVGGNRKAHGSGSGSQHRSSIATPLLPVASSFRYESYSDELQSPPGQRQRQEGTSGSPTPTGAAQPSSPAGQAQQPAAAEAAAAAAAAAAASLGPSIVTPVDMALYLQRVAECTQAGPETAAPAEAQQDAAPGSAEGEGCGTAPPPAVAGQGCGGVVDRERLRSLVKSDIFYRGGTVEDPPDVRRKCWALMLSLEDGMAHEGYAALLERYKEALLTGTAESVAWFSEQEKAIEKDATRTDRGEHLFCSGDGPSVEMLRNLLRAYVTEGEGRDIGYIQGMSDVASVAITVMWHLDGPEDEAGAELGDIELQSFRCFQKLMHFMGPNFLDHAERSRKKLMRLLECVNLPLYAHLRDHDPDAMFAFRWMFMYFKREFPLSGVMRVWDVVLAAPVPDYHTVIGVALLHKLGVQIQQMESFSSIMRFCQSLHGNVRASDTLAHTHALYTHIDNGGDIKFRDILQHSGDGELSDVSDAGEGEGEDVSPPQAHPSAGDDDFEVM